MFTDPEIAWTGLTEREAEQQGIKVNIGRFRFFGARARARWAARTAW
ncbi:MAG: hypothetical protein IPO18_03580 [bacterium]|nr:hypothetical protein [bacterium]